MNITLKQIRVFLAVVERGSIVRAAASLHLTPPAVSMQIRDLEKQAGVALFARDKQRLRLAVPGEQFQSYAKRILVDIREVEKELSRFKRLDRGSLTVGIVGTGAYFVPDLVARFNDKHPGIEVRIRAAGTRERLVSLMDTADVDLSILLNPPKHHATRASKFALHPYVVVCAPHHPLVGVKSAAVASLGEYPLIAREQGSGTRNAMERFFAEHHCKPRISMEIESNETIKRCVIVGMGIAFLSLHGIGLELENGLLRVLDVVDTPATDVLSIVHLDTRILSPSAQVFQKFILENGGRYMRAADAKLLSIAFKRKISIARTSTLESGGAVRRK